jgi:hypothetical protein
VDLLMLTKAVKIIGKELERLKIPSEIRKWAQQHNLSSHPLVIQKLRFQCSKCNKSYDRPGKLLEHIKVKHKGIRYPRLLQALYYISRPASTSTNPPRSLHPSTKKTDDSI